MLLRIQVQVLVQKQKECHVQLLRFHDPGMGEEVQCSAGKLFYAGRCWWVGAQGLPSAQYARTRHSATTLSQTLARRKSEIEIFGRRWKIGSRGARGCEVEGGRYNATWRHISDGLD